MALGGESLFYPSITHPSAYPSIIHLSTYEPICPCNYPWLSIYPSHVYIHLHIHPSNPMHPFIHHHPSTYLVIHPSTQSPIYLFTHLSIYPSTYLPNHPSTQLPIYPTIYLLNYSSTYVSIYPTTPPSAHTYIYPFILLPINLFTISQVLHRNSNLSSLRDRHLFVYPQASVTWP